MPDPFSSPSNFNELGFSASQNQNVPQGIGSCWPQGTLGTLTESRSLTHQFPYGLQLQGSNSHGPQTTSAKRTSYPEQEWNQIVADANLPTLEDFG